MAKLKTNSQNKFKVWCQNCQQILILDSPEDLKKSSNRTTPILRIVCPNCKHEIWFDDRFNYNSNQNSISLAKKKA